MVYIYNGTKIYYKFYNKVSLKPVLLLHGWGSSGDVFKDLIAKFPEKSFLTVDFPPFGKSDKYPKNWNVFTYVGMLMSLLDYLYIDKCDVVGHSFGGRIAIILSAVKCSLVQSCILVDSAGMKPKHNLSYYYKIYNYKLRKKLGKSVLNMGSSDYLSLSPEMKKTFNSIVNTNLEEYCQRMPVKTLIVWGEKDKETPIYMAKRLNKKIRNSRIYIIKGAGHFCFLDCPFEFYKVVRDFWEEIWYM